MTHHSNSVFTRRSELAASAADVFAWHAREGAFQRLSPPWENVEIIEQSGGIEDGARVVVRVKIGPFWRRWVARHFGYVPGKTFCDEQLEGPFARFVHRHSVEPVDERRATLEDQIEYALPFGAIGLTLGGWAIRAKLRRMFDYRHETTANDLDRHSLEASKQPIRIAITGASGLVGTALTHFLTGGGHSVVHLVRKRRNHTDGDANEIFWNPREGVIDRDKLEGVDAVINLAGESIASGRWNDARKEAIRASRVNGTTLLVDALTKLQRPPKVLVNASAIGFYGSRGDELLDEQSPAGEGFLPDVCKQWEGSAAPAIEHGIRVAFMRFGIVLSPSGGALAKMLPPFRLGVGGKIGSGKQFMSWVALDDVLGAIHRAVFDVGLRGPVNVTAPNPVTNEEFTRVLGAVLRRPTFFPVPAGVLRIGLGEMADALLLESTQVMPRRLLECGFAFHYPELEGALRYMLGRTSSPS